VGRPSRVTTDSRGTSTTGASAAAGAASSFSGSRKVTFALISGFRSLSLSRIVTLTWTVAFVRSAVGMTCRRTAL
jgi:hypothetical protein